MADLHFREKFRNIEKAASSNEIPDKSKNIGLGCFALATILFIGFLLFLGISLFINGIVWGSICVFLVSLLFIIILIKLWSAPNLP